MLTTTTTGRNVTGRSDANLALLIRQPMVTAATQPLDRVPTMLKSDVSGFLEGTLPKVIKYSVMELTHGDQAKLILRRGSFREPHSKIVSDAVAEAKRADLSLEITAVKEPGVITRIGDLVSINDYTGTGIALGLLKGTASDRTRIQLR